MESGKRIVGILIILFGGILTICALFLKTVPSVILSVSGKVIIVVGMFVLFTVQNEI